jgi:hypothetical protein
MHIAKTASLAALHREAQRIQTQAVRTLERSDAVGANVTDHNPDLGVIAKIGIRPAIYPIDSLVLQPVTFRLTAHSRHPFWEYINSRSAVSN